MKVYSFVNKNQLSNMLNNLKVFDSGIDHLEFLKEKNTLARKRLLELQKRLVEIKVKGSKFCNFDDLKLPQALDQSKECDTLNLIQKYASINLIPNKKSHL